ncbi:hypothetical protein BpHYR1_016985 [Brachionus plicatilis]|uniref:Uncharacterized protein n=1 Tax=Brachionus plicatilis TaxID=10195 RepID=A0A3M7QI24_BRAPC|nr:hypothetical protein BpHYR1_016985 [Brachionus plicatilis]
MRPYCLLVLFIFLFNLFNSFQFPKVNYFLIKVEEYSIDDVHVDRDRAYTRSLHTDMCLS